MDRLTLVLDLDETLVHCSTKTTSHNSQEVIISYERIPSITEQVKCYVYKRPFLDEFLEKMDILYDITIFTSSIKGYADPVIDYIDPRKIIKKRYYREV